ncbi:hypothetical protein JCM33374_g428 [Metschnikowia sp. JCM 33374]|nr:hypothetical protein JCM33374_g428 [Metschnikowia sp. JCM 33374]
MSPLPSPSSSPTCSINNSDLEDYIDVENKVVSDNVLSGEKRTDTSATATGVDSTDEGSTNEGSTEKDSTHENSTHENSPDEKDDSESEEYQGTMVKPLSYFGSFEIDPPILELKWISDHTSGNVHKDMATISMLYNQDLTLPETAQNFIEQSPELLEEARWERLKAAFYGFYPNNIQDQAYAFLSGLSALEASRIIAKKTSRMEHEAILQPLSGKLYKSQKKAFKYEDKKILTSFNHGDNDYSLNDIRWGSGKWRSSIENYQVHTKSSVEAQLFLFQLQHSKARYEPRTQWIHVKTSPLYPDGKINSEEKVSKNLFRQVSMLFETRESLSGPNSMTMNKEVNRQFQRFEYWLQKYGTGPFGNFDALINNDFFQAYEFRVSYESVSPTMCSALLDYEFGHLDTWIIVSKPDISGYQKEYHSILVYFNAGNSPYNTICKFGSTLRKTDPYDFCFNCFGKDHNRTQCMARNSITTQSGMVKLLAIDEVCCFGGLPRSTPEHSGTPSNGRAE